MGQYSTETSCVQVRRPAFSPDNKSSDNTGESAIRSTCTIIEREGIIIGMLVVFPMRVDLSENADDPVLAPYSKLEQDNSYYICGMAVFPEHRGCGNGAHLLALAKKHTRDRGLREQLVLQQLFRMGAWHQAKLLTGTKDCSTLTNQAMSLIVPDSLFYFLVCVHHKWPMLDHRVSNRFTADQDKVCSLPSSFQTEWAVFCTWCDQGMFLYHCTVTGAAPGIDEAKTVMLFWQLVSKY